MSLSRDTSEAHWIEDICVNWEAGCQRWWRCSCICCVIFRQVLRSLRGFPGGSVVKNPSPMQETQETWVNPWVRKIPWWKKWQPDPVFLPEKPYGQRSLAGYSSKGCKERDTIKHAGRSLKQLSTHAALDHLNSLGVVSLSLNWDNNGHVFSKMWSNWTSPTGRTINSYNHFIEHWQYPGELMM